MAGGLAAAPVAAQRAGIEEQEAVHATTRLVDGPIPALLSIPTWTDAAQPAPLVILLGDGPGVDRRLDLYARRLLSLGIAVLEPDFGLGLSDEMNIGTVALVPVARRLGMSLEALAAVPEIDRARIGALGLGEGARALLLSAAEHHRVAAAALLYPGCDPVLAAATKGGAPGLAGAPVLLLHGDEDPGNLPEACGALATALGGPAAGVTHRVLHGATYAWDQPPNGAPGSGATLLPDPADPASRLRALPDPVRALIGLDRVLGFLLPHLLTREPLPAPPLRVAQGQR